MSVQVRRRREAASFLQSYVGAQGELLVDTTGNRVQVHDGATPGGWPAAGIGDLTGHNAIINGNFAINQRAYVSGTAVAQFLYGFHDRWKAGGNGGTYTFSESVPDTTITITSGSIVQAIEASNVAAASWWLTWTGTAQARVYQGAQGGYSTGTPAIVGGVAVNTLLVTGLTIGTVTLVEFSSGTLGLVQLEAALRGAGPTRFERRHLGQELALCQRYFGFMPIGTGVWGPVATYFSWSSGFAVPMRAVPTALSVTGTVQQVFQQSYAITSAAPIYFGATTQVGLIVVQTQAGPNGVSGIVLPGTNIALSAEI